MGCVPKKVSARYAVDCVYTPAYIILPFLIRPEHSSGRVSTVMPIHNWCHFQTLPPAFHFGSGLVGLGPAVHPGM